MKPLATKIPDFELSLLQKKCRCCIPEQNVWIFAGNPCIGIMCLSWYQAAFLVASKASRLSQALACARLKWEVAFFWLCSKVNRRGCVHELELYLLTALFLYSHVYELASLLAVVGTFLYMTDAPSCSVVTRALLVYSNRWFAITSMIAVPRALVTAEDIPTAVEVFYSTNRVVAVRFFFEK